MLTRKTHLARRWRQPAFWPVAISHPAPSIAEQKLGDNASYDVRVCATRDVTPHALKASAWTCKGAYWGIWLPAGAERLRTAPRTDNPNHLSLAAWHSPNRGSPR